MFVHLCKSVPLQVHLNMLSRHKRRPFNSTPFKLRMRRTLQPRPYNIPLNPFRITFTFSSRLRLIHPLRHFIRQKLLPFKQRACPIRMATREIHSKNLRGGLRPLLIRNFNRCTRQVRRQLTTHGSSHLHQAYRHTISSHPRINQQVRFQVPHVLNITPTTPRITPTRASGVNKFPHVRAFTLGNVRVLSRKRRTSSIRRFNVYNRDRCSIAAWVSFELQPD